VSSAFFDTRLLLERRRISLLDSADGLTLRHVIRAAALDPLFGTAKLGLDSVKMPIRCRACFVAGGRIKFV
jgi:hypothetical protein